MAKKRSKSKRTLKQFLTPKLRRLSYQWSARKNVKRAARIERGKYECASCEEIFGPKEISLDHVSPVIDPQLGFINWDIYINNLFCDESGFQVLCHGCHDIKTALENEIRRDVKAELQKELKKRKKPLTNKKKDDKIDI